MITFIISFFSITSDQNIMIGLFSINFLIIGLVSTFIIYPKTNTKQIIRKIILILGFAIIFSLISAIITIYFMQLTMTSILLVMTIISIILILIAVYRTKHDKDIFNINIDIENSTKKSLYVIIILGLVTLVGILIPPFNIIPVWYGLCAPFVAFIPGYYILNSLLPKKDELTLLERVGIAVFLSLIITSTIGLILYGVESSINMAHTSIVLIILTYIIIIPAYLSRVKKVNNNQRYTHPKINRALLFITIIGLLALILVGITITTENLTKGNTTFVVEGINQTAGSDGYINMTSNENITSQVNITNHENKKMSYTMKIEIHNETSKVLSEEKITLKDEESKVIPVNLTMTPGRKDIQYVLYTQRGQPYIKRHLYVNVI